MFGRIRRGATYLFAVDVRRSSAITNGFLGSTKSQHPLVKDLQTKSCCGFYAVLATVHGLKGTTTVINRSIVRVPAKVHAGKTIQQQETGSTK